MNHPHPDELLLFASGELAELRLVEVAAHLPTCATCQATLAQLERALVALDRDTPPSRRGRPVVWTGVAGVALAAAAALAVVFTRPSPESPRAAWVPTITWSRTAGYMAGGQALLDIDAQLTRLEQEPHYARP